MGLLNSKFRLFIAAIFLATGTVFFLVAINIEKKMWSSKNWPSVKGKVLKSDVTVVLNGSRQRLKYGGGTSYYKPHIVYNYTVNNKNYTSERITLGISDSYRNVSEIYVKYLDRYPKDKMIDVYYNPANPGLAVLEPCINNGNTWYYLVFVLLVLCGIFLIINFFTGFGDSFIENNFCRE